jgi:alkanesulfonate monooxygenase SsuD/methylene tetrahydromethanopterin reductase-like flavin-dependent oxidoreductase (luciferase family)
VRFSTAICLLPFNHPVRLAEDLAVLDNLSGGRVELGVGMGYAPHEFRGFGIPFSRRVSLMNEGIEVLQRCFTGERFSYQGKRYSLDDIQITPGYVQAGGPPLWVASMSAAGAERAARYHTNFLPQGLRSRSYDPWVNAVKAQGREPQDFRVGLIRSVLVTDDRNTDWEAVRAAERYRMELYVRFNQESGEGFDSAAGERVPQTWVIGNVDECVEQIVSFAVEFGITDMVTMAVPPGLRPAQMSHSLERLFRDVAPRVKAALDSR